MPSFFLKLLLVIPMAVSACHKHTQFYKRNNIAGRNNWVGERTASAVLACPEGKSLVDFDCNVEASGFSVEVKEPHEEGVRCVIRNNNRRRRSAAIIATVVCAAPEDVAANTARADQCDTVSVRKRSHELSRFASVITEAQCDDGMVMVKHECEAKNKGTINGIAGFGAERQTDTSGANAIYNEEDHPIGIQCRGRALTTNFMTYDGTIVATVQCRPKSVLEGVALQRAEERKEFEHVRSDHTALTVTANCPEGTKVLASECKITGKSAGSFSETIERDLLCFPCDDPPKFEFAEKHVRCSMVKLRGVLQTASLTTSILCVDESFDPFGDGNP